MSNGKCQPPWNNITNWLLSCSVCRYVHYTLPPFHCHIRRKTKFPIKILKNAVSKWKGKSALWAISTCDMKTNLYYQWRSLAPACLQTETTVSLIIQKKGGCKVPKKSGPAGNTKTLSASVFPSGRN
uniref:Uncharacterized protein n=1 Tax=Melopsittacus undulatus TaxID=13146 RepID=A0A8V5H8T5_MELUD